MRVILTIVVTLSQFVGYAQQYDVASIPDSLKENAHAVIRWDEASYQIDDIYHATYKSHTVVTILREDAEYYAKNDLWYDGNSEIVSFVGKLYDGNGQLIKETKKKDIHDGAYSSYSIFDDNRYKLLDLTHHQFPYTVEFIYEKTYDNLFYIEDWYTLSSDNVSLESSNYTIISPSELNPIYKMVNTNLTPAVDEQNGIVKTIFEFGAMTAKEREAYGKAVYKTSPKVLIVPRTFDFDGYVGSFESWDRFNDWMRELISDRTQLTPEVVAKAQELTASLGSNTEKIEAIYEYLQNNTRYVSIQLGIGGYQPFPAMMVDEKGYGDCKALSNYTYSLLKAIGIQSHHVLVDGGRNPRDIDKVFPNNTFNHMILCVPNDGDTLWLECTSQTNPFGYQGKFTGDRDVLLITEEGGKIVHTTIYPKKDNIQSRTAKVVLNTDGNGTASVSTRYSGLQYENNNLDYYYTQAPDKQEKWVLDNTEIPNFDLVSFDFEIEKGRIPSITQTLDVQLKKYAQISGERIFIPLNLMNKLNYLPPRTSNRLTDIEIKVPFIDYDSIVYQIPESIHPEHLPEPISFETQFGEYESRVEIESGKMIYIRKFGMNKGTFPKEAYEEFRDFYKQVRKADKSKVVFLKNT